MNVTDARYTPAEAADLAGVSRVALQGWCDRSAFVVARTANPAGWRRFGLWDVARLALINELRGYGVTVAGAADIVDVELGWQVENLVSTGRTAPAELADAFKNHALVVYRSAGPNGICWDLVNTVPVDADPRVAELTSFVALRVGPVVSRVFAAAADELPPGPSRGRKTQDTERERRARLGLHD